MIQKSNTYHKQIKEYRKHKKCTSIINFSLNSIRSIEARIKYKIIIHKLKLGMNAWDSLEDLKLYTYIYILTFSEKVYIFFLFLEQFFISFFFTSNDYVLFYISIKYKNYLLNILIILSTIYFHWIKYSFSLLDKNSTDFHLNKKYICPYT